MKRLLTGILAISMLTACATQNTPLVEETTVTEETSLTTETTTTEITSITLTEESTVTQSTEYAPNFELLPNMRIIKTNEEQSDYNAFCSLGDGKIVALAYDEDGKANLFIYDTDTDIEKMISLPNEFVKRWGYYNIRKGRGDTLYVLTSENYEFEEEDENYIAKRASYTQDVIKIKTDYSLEYIKNANIKDVGFDMNGHTIGVWDSSIYDLSNEPKVIIEGKPWDDYLSNSMNYREFSCAIDDNRFISSSHYYEGVGGFSIYDFTKSKVVFQYESGTQVVGVHNNKIYFILSEYAWDGDGKIYVCDADTFETSVYIDVLSEFGGSYLGYLCMSPNGEYMAYKLCGTDCVETFIINTNTKEVIAKYNVGNIERLFFVDNDTLAVSTIYSPLFLIDF